MSADQIGFELSNIHGDLPDNVLCSLCERVLRHPMQCPQQQHSFCKSCILRRLRHTKSCPDCEEPLTKETLEPCERAIEVLGELKIRCKNIDCAEVMKLDELETHVSCCAFTQIQCGKCELMVNRGELQQHEQSECLCRTVECQVCGEEVNYRKRKLHCYVTNKDMNDVKKQVMETKDEICAVKEAIVNMSKCLSRQLTGVKENLNEVKQSVTSINREYFVMQKEVERNASFELNIGVPVKTDIIIAGGVDVLSVEKFSWFTMQWTKLKPMKLDRYLATAFVYKGRMYVCGGRLWEGGDTLMRLSLVDDNADWEDVPVKLPQEVFSHVSIVYKNEVVVIGGESGLFASQDIDKVSLIEPYDSKLVCRMPEPRMHHGAELFDDKVVIVGGSVTGSKGGILNSVLMYDITKNCCMTLAPLPFPVRLMATIAWKDTIIVIGGEDKNENILNTVFSYNVTVKNVKMLPPMKQKRSECTAVLSGNVIVVMGGWTGSEKTNSVECFDFATNMWKDLPPMKERRCGAPGIAKPFITFTPYL